MALFGAEKPKKVNYRTRHLLCLIIDICVAVSYEKLKQNSVTFLYIV